MSIMKSKKMTFFEIFKRFFGPIRKNPKLYMRGFFVKTLWATPPVFAIIMAEQLTYAIEAWNQEQFWVILIGFIVGIFVLEASCFVFRNWGWVSINTLGNISVYEDVIEEFLHASNTEVEKIGTGKIIAIIQKGMDIRSRAITSIIHFLPRFVLVFGLTFYLLLRSQWWLCFVFVGLIGLSYLFSLRVNKRTVRQRNITRDISNEWTRRFVRVVMSKFEILQSGQVNWEIEAFKRNTREQFESEKKRSLDVEFFFRVPETSMFVIKFLIYGVIGYWIFGNTFSYADLVVFIGALGLMDRAVIEIIKLVFDLTRDFSVIEKLWTTMDELPAIQTKKKLPRFVFKKWAISFEKVTFCYDSDTKQQKVLAWLNLELKGWKKTAFVWPSWWGKSTLVKLISGYIAPDKWKVIVDGQTLSNIKLSDYYKHVGYLTQEPSIFDGTIRENLLYALPGGRFDETSLQRVIKMAKCEFIYDFKKWLDTEIGERGVRLSWWQKQRLAIAKIMLKNPEIILLDEPTSALDSMSEQKISEALQNLFKWKTVIVIAHRLQTVKEADDILVIDKGQVVERWTHKQLEKMWGMYKEMMDLQTTF